MRLRYTCCLWFTGFGMLDGDYNLVARAVIVLLTITAIVVQIKVGSYISQYPKRGIGAVLLILGCGFVYAWIYMLTKSGGRIGNIAMSLIVLFAGLIFALIGFFYLRKEQRASARSRQKDDLS